MHISYN